MRPPTHAKVVEEKYLNDFLQRIDDIERLAPF